MKMKKLLCCGRLDIPADFNHIYAVTVSGSYADGFTTEYHGGTT